MKNFLKSLLASLHKITHKLRYLIYVIIFFIAVYLVFWIPIFIKTYDLRTKDDYSRTLTVTFIYKGDEYTINSNIKCINKGVTINEGTMEWYNKWSMSYEPYLLTLKDNVEAKLWFNPLPLKDVVEAVFQDSIRGNTNSICDIILFEDSKIDKVKKLMQFDEQYNTYRSVSWNKESIEKFIKLPDPKNYQNNTYNLLNIRDTKYNNNLNLEIISISFGNNKTILKKHW